MPIRFPFPQTLFASVSTAALTATMSVGPALFVTSPAAACTVMNTSGIDGVPYNTTVANPGGGFTCNEFIQNKVYDGVNTTFTTNAGNITLPGQVFLTQPGGGQTSIATTVNGSNVLVILGTGPVSGDCSQYGSCTLPTIGGDDGSLHNRSQNLSGPVNAPIFAPVITGVPSGPRQRTVIDAYGQGFNQRQNISTSGGAGTPSSPIAGLPTYVPYAEADGSLDDKMFTLVNGLPPELIGGCSLGAAASCSEQMGQATDRLGQAMDPETRDTALQFVYVSTPTLVPTKNRSDGNWQFDEVVIVDDDDGSTAPGSDIFDADKIREIAQFADDDDGNSTQGNLSSVIQSADDYYEFTDEFFTDDDDDSTPQRGTFAAEVTDGIANEVERLNTRIRNETDPNKKKELESRRDLILSAVNQFGQDSLRTAVSRADAKGAPVARR